MIVIKTPAQIEGIRKSSKLAAETLNYLTPFVKPGVTTQYLNDLAHKYIVDHKAVPLHLDTADFQKVFVHQSMKLFVMVFHQTMKS
jgi:methionyl aminopeptidase